MTAPSNKKQRVESPPPPPIDGTKPIQLQRRRVYRACMPCRRKKTKCSGTTPVCPQCQATNTQCTWMETKDRAALSRHYVQELEARLLYMEQLFKTHAPHIEVFPPEGSGLPPEYQQSAPNLVKSFGPANEPKQEELDDLLPTRDHPEEEEETAPLSEHFGQMALDAEGHMRWIGGSSTMTLIETFRNETASPGDGGGSPLGSDNSTPNNSNVNMLYFPTGLGFGKLQALPYAEEVEYPERDLADLLVDAYFDKFHFLLPVIDKPAFLQRYRRLMDAHGTGERPGFVAVVFAVFACAARFVEDPRIRAEGTGKDGRGTAMVFYERSMMLYYISATSTQLAHVQCFALLSTFLASLNRLPQAWLLVGQAVRTAQDLGLHRSPRPLMMSPIDKETRRKVWWCVYGLDRMLAVQLGRPLGIDDMDIDAELPLPFEDDDLSAYFENKLADRAPTSEPTLMQGFIGLTRLYRIAGRVLRHVYSLDKLRDQVDEAKMKELKVVVDRLDGQLDKWCQDLHPSFRTNPSTPQMTSISAVLCSSYYAVLITLHRSFLPSRRNISQAIGSTSVPKAIAASRSCIFLATSMGAVIPPSHHLAIFIQYLFSSGLIILLVVMHATHKGAAEIAMSEVDNCRVALEKLEPQWPGANKCKDLLIELSQVTRDSLAKGGKAIKAFAAAAAVHTAGAVPPENAHIVGPSNRGFQVGASRNTLGHNSSGSSARQSISPGSSTGTFPFNSPAGLATSGAHLSPSPPLQQLSGSLKRRREETPEPGAYANDTTAVAGPSTKRPTHRHQLSAPSNIQGLALSNVSPGQFAPFLSPQVSVYQSQLPWQAQAQAQAQQQLHPPMALPLDHEPVYTSSTYPTSGLSPLVGQLPSMLFAGAGGGGVNGGGNGSGSGGNEMPMFDVHAVPPYDIHALPPFSGMDQLWPGGFEGNEQDMELWNSMPDAFSSDPRTPFGLGEDGLLNMNGDGT